MTFKRLTIVVLVFFFFLSVNFHAHAQEEDAILKESGLKSKLIDLIIDNPGTINKVIIDMIKEDSPLRKIVDNVEIRLKAFDSDTEEDNGSLGFSYTYSKDIARYNFSQQKNARHTSLALNFSSEGNVAFDREINPEDFMDTDLSLLLFHSTGGVDSASADVSDLLNELEDIAVEQPTREDLLKNKAVQEAVRINRSHLSTQIYTELSVDAGMESNQSFTKKQYYYGLHAGLDVKAWNPDSTLAKYNILDYPFALTRYLLGNDPKWMPRGSVLPTLLVGIDQVNPQDNDPRELAGDDTDFARIRMEASYRTLVGHMNGHSTFFEMNFRYYQELDPVDTIKDATLDQYTSLSAALLLPRGMYISYATGRLPLDAEEDRVYELGFRYSF
ncbi:MAG: hypothetical protein ACMUIL_01780 [bacterium]